MKKIRSNIELINQRNVVYAGSNAKSALFFISTSLKREVKKGWKEEVYPLLVHCSKNYNTLDKVFVARWRKEQPKILFLDVIEGGIEIKSEPFLYLGLNDFTDYKDKDIKTKDEICRFLERIDLSVLFHLYAQYWHLYTSDILTHIDVESMRATFEGDVLPHHFHEYARLGIFDDLLIQKGTKEEILKFPEDTGNKLVSLFANFLLLGNLCQNDVLIKQTLFDEYKWPFFEPRDTINVVTEQQVSNRKMIDRQFKLLKEHFWDNSVAP